MKRMDIEIASKQDKMAFDAKGIFRFLENESQDIEILVRESIQNSLDAADKNTSNRFVEVEFGRSSLDLNSFSEHFDLETEKNMKHKYTNKKCDTLFIKDKNTIGLDGPLQFGNEKGNFVNLIFDMQTPQEAAGAGGSWGLGKTIYYRVGMGLVLFYSRIKIDTNIYEERFAACLIEDPEKRNIFHKESDNRGIAWWGKCLDGSNTVAGINDSNFIESIMKSLNIERYKDNETGTTIILPFMNFSELFPTSYMDDVELAFNDTSIEGLFNQSIQRWYAPRLNNRNYPGKYLKVNIFGEFIKLGDMYSTFSIIRKFYSLIMQNKSQGTSLNIFESKDNNEIELYKIALKSLESGGAGWLAFSTFTMEELNKEGLTDNLSPLKQVIGFENEDIAQNELEYPIIAYTRKPGMIIDYDYKGDFVKKVPYTEKGKYLIGLFVLESDTIIKGTKDKVEEYIRGTEKADHKSWQDVNFTLNKDDNSKETKMLDIVQKIQSNVAKKLNDSMRITSINTEEDISDRNLGHLLGKLILPKNGFGNSIKKLNEKNLKSNKSELQRKNSKPKIYIEGSPIFIADEIRITLVAEVYGKTKLEANTKLTVSQNLNSNQSSTDQNEWKNSFNTPFPFEIKKAVIESIMSLDGKKIKYTDEITCKRVGNNALKKAYGIKLEINNIKVEQIKINLTLKTNDRKWLLGIKDSWKEII